MAITDELRKWAQICSVHHDSKLYEIADRIDAEHESACAEAYGNGVMSVPIALDESAWVKLPVDADGEPIRVGDELVIFETGEHIRAYDIELYADERWLVIDEETMDSIHPDRLRHYHAPTVEDVLREFADRYLDYEGIPSAGRRGVGEALMDEYAKQLRLAEEDK